MAMASIAGIIRQHEDSIIKTWLDKALAAASARGLSAVAMENVMPAYLSALADALDGTEEPKSDVRRRRVRAHLSIRLRQGFDLAEILAEFVLLEHCIVATWSRLPRELQPSAGEVARLHAQVQVAITDVSETFHHHMLEDEQSEKRYLRLLQGIASEAFHEDSAPLRDRLRELLDIVMEAMGAQCAAFLAYDTSQSRFVLTASTGVGELESYAATLDPSSFAAEVAASEEPMSSYDPASTHLEIPEPLQRAGVRSLLGVRLPQRHELIGVMYVGISDNREFTPREIGRIASLGERLAVHLENAKLLAALHDRIESLARERSLREHFVSALAHDLRGPLSAARLAAELLAMDPASLERRRDLALRIDRNIERVDRMIRDLLDANRIRAGERLPLRLDTCDLVALAHQVAEEARTLHGDRFILDAEAPAVRGLWSADELHRALWNLVTNAVKYGAPKQPVTIAVERRDDVARVSVHNTGDPIPADEQAHIFDAYARARSAKAGDSNGWGLGLTLVRGVAEAHGGRVSVASDPESGTTFTLEVPLDARVGRESADDRASNTVH